MNAPKGYLVAIGGGEDKGERGEKEPQSNSLDFVTEGVLQDVVSLMNHQKPVIEVLTTATATPEESFANYKSAFTKLGCSAVHHLDIRDREAANDKKQVARVEKCSGVMLTGGDQARLSSILGGTLLLKCLKERFFNHPFVIAGTSAGAACMSGTMMNGGSAAKGNLKGTVELSLGLGFVNNLLIDTHFDARGRFGRLAQAIATQPGVLGVGLGEDTGVIIEKGTRLKAIGSSSVTLIDGSSIFYNNITRVKEGMPVSLAKLEVYLLSHSDSFELPTRAFTPVMYERMENE